MSDMVQVQVQFLGGMWRTVTSVMNSSQYIIRAMHNAQHAYPDKRIRTVDQNGRLIDML